MNHDSNGWKWNNTFLGQILKTETTKEKSWMVKLYEKWIARKFRRPRSWNTFVFTQSNTQESSNLQGMTGYVDSGSKDSHLFTCPVSWGCRKHWLHLCTGARPPPPMSVHDTKQSDGKVSVMLRLWGIRSTPSLPLLPVHFGLAW